MYEDKYLDHKQLQHWYFVTYMKFSSLALCCQTHYSALISTIKFLRNISKQALTYFICRKQLFINPPAVAALLWQIAIRVKISQLPVLTTQNNVLTTCKVLKYTICTLASVSTFWPFAVTEGLNSKNQICFQMDLFFWNCLIFNLII